MAQAERPRSAARPASVSYPLPGSNKAGRVCCSGWFGPTCAHQSLHAVRWGKKLLLPHRLHDPIHQLGRSVTFGSRARSAWGYTAFDAPHTRESPAALIGVIRQGPAAGVAARPVPVR